MSLSRRQLFAVAASAVAATASPLAAAARKGASQPKTFVLVHGAWHGAWCWQRVAEGLRNGGQRVYAPTLTGMGDRHHLSSKGITLETHIRDVIATIESEELTDVVLVAHSYAGYLAAAARDRIGERLSHVIYLDALLPVPGKAARDTWPPDLVANVEKTLIEGYRLASFPPELFDVPATDKANYDWMKRRLTDMPYGVFQTAYPATLPANAAATARVKQTFIRCTEAQLDGAKFALEAAKAAKMNIVMMKAGHNPMVTAPKMLVKELLRLG